MARTDITSPLDPFEGRVGGDEEPEHGQDNLSDATQERNRGRQVTVPVSPLGGDGLPKASNPQDVVYCEFPTARECTLMLQASGSGARILIRTSIGGSAKFSRSFTLPMGIPRSVRLFGTSIEVQVSGYANTTPVTVSGAIVEGSVDALGELWSTFVPNGAASGTNGLVATGSGIVLKSHGFLDGSPVADTNYYLQFYDTLSLPISGGASVPLFVIGPLVGGQPSSFAWDDTVRPDVLFNTGLLWALSTTPDGYTNPSDGARASVTVSFGN